MGKRRIHITIPEGPFTSRELKEQNPLASNFTLQSRLREWIGSNKVRRIGTRPLETGKGLYVYHGEGGGVGSVDVRAA